MPASRPADGGQSVGQVHDVSGGMQQPSPHTPTPASGLPHVPPGGQSLSLAMLQPGGQQPSPFAHAVIVEWLHTTLQVAGEPLRVSMVHALKSLQPIITSIMQSGMAGVTSQVSPGSTTWLPHDAEQLESVALVHPDGQQPSIGPHVVIVL